MISQNDLYDISYALIIMRNDIQYNLNSEILSRVAKVLEYKDKAFEDNQIRKALADIQGLNRERWNYVYHDNVYVNHQFLKNKQIYMLLEKLCVEARSALLINNYDRAYDLIDCFHCLPTIIADNHFTIPKSYWKTYVNPYRNKWDKTFLITEQKAIIG